MTRREAIAALAGLWWMPECLISDTFPQPGPNWSTWTEGAEDMARFELRAIRDHERLRRARVPWLPPYESAGVIAWTDDVSLVFASSNHNGDVSDVMRLAVDYFRQVGVTVLGAGLTPCKSVGCMFVWAQKRRTLKVLEDWVAEGDYTE